MTPRRVRQLVVWLLVACLAHLPVPVWDGNEHVAAESTAGASPSPRGEIDIILLGCDLPDDCDSIPGGNNEDGILDVGLGPAFLATGMVVPPGPLDAPGVLTAMQAVDAGLLSLAATDRLPAEWLLDGAAARRPALTVLRL